MPTPKQLSTARHRKNTQRRSFPRQRKFVFPRRVLIRRRSARKGWRLRHPFCCFGEIALRRGLKSSPRRGNLRDAVCAWCDALFPRALRVIQGFSLNARKQTDFILALLRGHKGHLEEGRGNLGTPFAPSAPPCSREHCELFRVSRFAPGGTHSLRRAAVRRPFS